MSFKQPKGFGNHTQKEWDTWLSLHRETLEKIGLPKCTYQSPSHWVDFLENGELHWHPEQSDGFYFLDLSKEQMAELLVFLENANIFEPDCYNILEWLRHNLKPNPDAGTG